ncbi:MAG: Permease YjgP/YjgQ family protein [Limisphaerales bacterium]|nr:MAG: Permease YjgP/YjgQ family protein [Limisphaerales bacterium]KAG0506664.1 MAG: Permease YjgP/YjgQ family protein [Limisphaerales bacterium]TXT47642.1 MAG: Permease YjgP/YjgQ family protein [Limisphaerales bacterium]
MRLLDRYLLRELMVPLLYCLGGFLIFFVSADLMNELPMLQGRGLNGWDIAEYYVFKSPELLPTVLPMGLLLALLYALAQHGKHHELVAIRAAGVSLWRLAAPYLAVGAVASVALFIASEIIGPHAQAATEDVLNRYRNKLEQQTELQWKRDVNFNNDVAGHEWKIGAFGLLTHEMLRVNVTWTGRDNVRRILFANRAGHTNGVWHFTDAELWAYVPPNLDFPLRTRTNLVVFPELDELPRLIKSEIKINTFTLDKMAKKLRFSLAEILDYQRLHPRLTGSKADELNTQFHGRLAAPFTCFVVVLLALPFGAAPGRRNVAIGVAASIGIGFAFFVLSRLSLVLGTGGHVPGWVAGWAPNVIFAAVGIELTRRLR